MIIFILITNKPTNYFIELLWFFNWMLSKDHRCRPTLKQVIQHPWLNKEIFNERFVTLN